MLHNTSTTNIFDNIIYISVVLKEGGREREINFNPVSILMGSTHIFPTITVRIYA